MERLIKFKNYRNIGIEAAQTLVLNTSLELGKMGSVVILLGENNLGKTSVIQGIVKYGNNTLNKNDDCYDNDFENTLSPEISLITRDGNNEFYHDKNLKVQSDSEGYHYQVDEVEIIDHEGIYNELIKIKNNFSTIEARVHSSFYNYICYFNDIMTHIVDVISLENLSIDLCRNLREYLNWLMCNYEGTYPDNYKQLIEENVDYNSVLEYLEIRSQNYSVRFKNAFKDKYGFEFEPHIYEYKGITKKVEDSQLTSGYDYSNECIIGVVLNYLGVDKSQVMKYYDNYRQTNSVAPLNNLTKKVNSKMSIINDKFNSIFKSCDSKYSFEFKFQKDGIFLNVNYGDKQLVVKRNSEGFSWFFNFFFMFILKHDTKPGDIILLDDQAYGLMPMGIHELHKYLEEYSLKKDVTFVIATANEHFVDINHLDEIRVLNRIDEDKAEIVNKVSLFNDGDVDTLKFLKQSIMVTGNIFDNDDVQQTYVEGITDYNYLTAFAKMLKVTNLSFIPFNGVKKEDIVIKLRRKHHTNVFLVDGDAAALKFKENNKDADGTVIISLADVDEKFKNIEDLFTKEELSKFNLSQKSYNESTNFKKNIDKYWDEISSITKENFKKLLDCIYD